MSYNSSRLADEQYYEFISRPESLPFFYTYNGLNFQGFVKEKMISCSTDRQEEKETTELVFGLDDVLTAKVKLTHYFDFWRNRMDGFF